MSANSRRDAYSSHFGGTRAEYLDWYAREAAERRRDKREYVRAHYREHRDRAHGRSHEKTDGPARMVDRDVTERLRAEALRAFDSEWKEDA